MDWRNNCVRRANDCEEKAKQASDSDLQALYQMLAHQWRQLACVPKDQIHGPKPFGGRGR